MSVVIARRAGAALLSVIAAVPAHAQRRTVDWPVVHGDHDHTHYTTLSQITPANVRQLREAWRYDTRDAFEGSEFQANPVVVDGTMYLTTPRVVLVALDAATGRERWRFDPNNGAAPTSRLRHRGVVVTGDRVLFNYRNRLYAIDRMTGQPIRSFGRDGMVDLREGLGRPVEGLSVGASSPGVVFEDLFIIGSTVPEALPSAPGDIRAYDVKTGALRWSFHTIPHPGEFGYETWPPEAWKVAGGANAWSGVTLDVQRGMLFAATGSASFDFFGGNRLGDNLFANSILALDARTGRRRWHMQTLRHDLWDRDLPAAPTLVTVRHRGRRVDAVAQITKTGHVYVLERETGRSLFPIDSVAMPEATLPGERTAERQPFPRWPKPFSRQALTEDGLTDRTPEARAAALKVFREYATPHPFSSPNTRGTIIFPGVDGGGEWGGPAFDRETGTLYVNANEMAWLLKMVPRSDRSTYGAYCASCHGEERKGGALGPSLEGVATRRTREQLVELLRSGTGRMPGFAGTLDAATIGDLVNFLVTGVDVATTAVDNPTVLPYRATGFDIFLDHEGYPAIKPPWGTLNAIDLNTGRTRWSVPLGEYPKLAAQGLRDTGTDNYGGAIVTRNGLLFIAATTYDNRLRAFDKRNGRLLWEATLPFAGNATPSTYMVNGRQYLVIAAGGGKNGAPSGGVVVAFALPDGRAR